ncbi:MAG TPA: hypothetical protein VGR26_14955 [Acidimicrobiales bacterium]|nr:hypothetical protein [Acidimicrobiales bacterium]
MKRSVKLRYRNEGRCGSCNTTWSSGWFQPRDWPVPLCADCNCPCDHIGYDHSRCLTGEDGRRRYWWSHEAGSGPLTPQLSLFDQEAQA